MARESPFSSITFALLISHLFPHFLNIKKIFQKNLLGDSKLTRAIEISHKEKLLFVGEIDIIREISRRKMQL